MTYLKSLLTSSLLALTLASGAAMAVPTIYHVDVSTRSFADEGSGYLELSFASPGTAFPATATVSNLTGVSGGLPTYTWGSVDAAAGGQYSLSTPDAALWQAFTYGGLLGFDLTLDGPSDGIDGARFTVGLIGGDGDYFAQDVVAFDLFAGEAPVIQASEIALVTEVPAGTDVPEPAEWALVMTGLGLMGAIRRRRRA
jgi:hypothetical protein